MSEVDFGSIGLNGPAPAAAQTEMFQEAPTQAETPKPPPEPPQPEPEPPSPEPEPTEPEQEDDIPFSDREKSFLARMEQLTGDRLRQPQNLTPEAGAAPAAPPTSEPEHNFFEGLDYDEVLSKAENLNRLLLKVHGHSMEQSRRRAVEDILRNLPQIVSQYVTQHMTWHQMAEKFYQKYPALNEARNTVAYVSNEVANENPKLTPEQVLEETAQRVLQMMKMKRGGVNPPVPPPSPPAKKPAFVSQRGRAKMPELQGLAKEIEELISM